MVCNEQISRGTEFQMAGVRTKVATVWSGEKLALVRGAKRTDRLVIEDK